MANIIVTSKEKKEAILNAFLAGGDNRIGVIAKRHEVSNHTVSRIVDDYFKNLKQ